MAKAEARTAQEEKHVGVALRFFELVAAGKPKDARDLFTPDCVQHNPYLPEGIDALLDSIAAVQGPQASASGMASDMRMDTKHVLVEGDLVVVHMNIQSSSDKSKGFRQMHLFRFDGDKIAEYWDVTQTAPPNSPNAYRMF